MIVLFSRAMILNMANCFCIPVSDAPPSKVSEVTFIIIFGALNPSMPLLVFFISLVAPPIQGRLHTPSFEEPLGFGAGNEKGG